MIYPYCSKKAQWCDNALVYGKRYGKSYMCYWCKDCEAYVGCHNNTRIPLGTMANRETRAWRKKAHDAIDPYWKEGRLEHWSLTTIREKLVKIGTKVVAHGRYVTFQMAEIAVPRDLFLGILRLIDGLRGPSPAAG